MPHQCLKCQEIYDDDSNAILKGCVKCKSMVFMYMKTIPKEDVCDESFKISKEDKKVILKELEKREDIKEKDRPVILKLENVRILDDGKYEIDINQLFSGDKPLIYKIDSGTYILDLEFLNKNSKK